MFFTNGVLLAGLLPRYPEIKQMYGLSATSFGFLVIAMPLGAIAAATFAAPLIRRFGARMVNGVSSVVLALVFAAAVQSPTPWGFALGLALAGFTDAIADSAQNVQGVVVEQWKGRSIINSLHALWSLGATCGGLIGTFCGARGIALTTQVTVNGAVWILVALLGAYLAATPGDRGTEEEPNQETHEPRASGHRPWRLLLPLIVLSICGTLMEEVANSWSALFFTQETAAPANLVGLGFTIVLACQFIGRILGDPMTDRWGREAVAAFGGILVAIGMATAMLSPSWQLSLIGFGAMGFGSATLVPAAFAASARVPGLAHGSGVAILGWFMRLGFLFTSPVIGVVADNVSLRTALLIPLAAGLLAAFLSDRIRRRQLV